MKESYIRLTQYLLGLVIAVLILFHFQLFASVVGPGYIDAQKWEAVAARMDNVFYDALYTVLLFALLTHGFIGIRNILFEYTTEKKMRILISWTLFIVYILLMAYGMAPIIVSAGL